MPILDNTDLQRDQTGQDKACCSDLHEWPKKTLVKLAVKHEKVVFKIIMK